MSEVWKIAPLWPLYQVSSLGRVRRAVAGRGTRAGKVLKAQPGTNGYSHVTLCDGEGRKSHVGINILVCQAFHGAPPSPGMHAAHDDGDKGNNSEANLYWATPRQNADDRIRHGNDFNGSRNPSSRLIETDIPKIRHLAKTISQSHAAKVFGVSTATVSLIVNNKRWSHVQ